jgi:hypothetical protein
MRTLAIVLLTAVSAVAPALAQTPELDAAAERAIVHVAGDLYQFRSGKQYSVFLVTRDGVVVVDPLGLYAASWLHKELQTRFPNSRIRYVVLTHHHAERAGGAGALKPETIVGHRTFRNALSDTSSRTGVDYRYVIAPQITFQDRHTIEIGGQTIELIHTGTFHSRDQIAVVFKRERLVFVADPPPASRVPFTIGSMRAAAVVNWFTVIASANVDTVMFGDGTTTAHKPIAHLAAYLGDMRRAVLLGYERGHSLNKTIETVRLDAHRTSPHYAARPQQIAEMYRQVRFARGDVVGSAVGNYLPEREAEFCSGYEHCESGGVVPGGTAAASIAFGRRFGFQVEFAISEQFFSSRAKPLYDEETALKPFITSALVRFNVTRSRTVSLLAGVTRVNGDVKGVDRVQGIFTPSGGRHAIEEAQARSGFTVGLEFSQRVGPLRLVVPLRVTQTQGHRPEFWPGRLQASAGVGLAIPFFRVLE